MFFSCGRKEAYLDVALRLAGDNRAELEKVLLHYSHNPSDSLKYRAAIFLIENMIWHNAIDYPDEKDYYKQIRSIFTYENKTRKKADSLFSQIKVDLQQKKQHRDVETLNATCLIDQIEHAFETRNYPWSASISWEDFCEYVLPYRAAQEQIEYWRPLYKQHMSNLLDSLVSVQADDTLVCRKLMDFFKPDTFTLVENSFPIPLRPSLYMEMNTGNCNDLTLYSLYAMRTAGLPVTYDHTPQWANRSLGHEWNALMSNGKAITFQIDDLVPFGEHLPSRTQNRIAKAYRKMYSIQKESLAMQFPKENIPPLFGNPFMKDVSEFYFKSTDVLTDLIYLPPSKKKYAYIMVFNNREWVPIGWGRIHKRQVTFPKMITGCAYMVMYYDNGMFHPASDPFYIDMEGKKKVLCADLQKIESVTLLRKYSFRDVAVITERMPGGQFQVANRADFKDAITVHVIDTLPVMTFQHVRLHDMPVCKYFRYLSSDKGHVYMAEMMVYDNEGRKLTGKIIGTEGTSLTELGFDKYKAFDGDCLTFFDAPITAGGWVGLEFEQKEQIQAIKYLPKNDDNHINENEEYELYYYDRMWVSLGRKTGDKTHALTYHNVPCNALLLLRNHTKGKEERIFTYENGKQVWW